MHNGFVNLMCQNGDSSHVLRIFDEEAQAMQSVRSSARELENANAVGEAILSTIHGQRERLKVSSLLPFTHQHIIYMVNGLIDRTNRSTD